MFGLVQIVDSIHFRGYFYKEGYIRTSSYEYDLENLQDKNVHLTNDAVQGKNQAYGQFEQANKISMKDFAAYFYKHKGKSFYEEVLPKVKEAIKDTMHAYWNKMVKLQQVETKEEKEQGKPGRENISAIGNYEWDENMINDTAPVIGHNQFELFGYDFMIDEDLKVYLIEVNTNPCLETPCALLQRLIPQVLDQTFKLAVDPFF